MTRKLALILLATVAFRASAQDLSSPLLHVYRASVFMKENKPDAAYDALVAAVDYGQRFNPDDARWNPLREQPRFASLVSLMRARTAPLLRSETAFLLEKDLIPENIVYDAGTKSFYVGSMYKAKIVRIDASGKVSDFVPSRRDGLLSVVGMKIDPVRRELWANAGNFVDRPPMEVDDPSSYGRGALFRFNLDTGKLIRKYDAPGGTREKPVYFNDLVLAPNGDVYISGGDMIWRLQNGKDVPEVFIKPAGGFFNGIAIAPDGKTLFGASHFQGVYRIDVVTAAHSLIDVPRGATLDGIDGLYVHEGSLVGVQNGSDPKRVVRAWLDPSMTRVVRFGVLEQDHPQSDYPLTGVIVGNDLYYVARSQLRAFDGKTIWPMDRLKETTILKLPLEVPAPAAVDLNAEKAALLAIHREGIRAHIELDAAKLATGQVEEMVAAYSGKVGRRTREQTLAFFKQYFDGAVYHEYVDLEEPIVRISDDGSMAWTITRLRVRRTQNGKETSFVYAGMMTYEKRNGQWLRTGNASTFE